MNNQIESYDIVVVGGGMVGAAAALGLAQAGWTVALIEQEIPAAFSARSDPDLRVSAISCASVTLLKQLGAWSAVRAMRATPYRRLETWEWEEANVSFDARSLDLPELGFIVENRLVQLGLWQQFEQTSRLTLCAPETLSAMEQHLSGWKLTLHSGRCLQTHLVVGADGVNSKVRQFAAIGLTGWQYRQACLLISVRTEQPSEDLTWQRFYPSGPRAFLPLHENHASLVWYDHPQRIRQLAGMSMMNLTQAVIQSFPDRLGAVEVISAGYFPLVRRHAQRYVRDGVALLGDAAHTINPLAGQGVNLGYRDLMTLLDVLISARDRGEHWFGQTVLMRYQQRRRPDNLLMQTGMDIFYKTFSNELPVLRIARNLALGAVERSDKLKQQALKYALGL